MSRLFQLIALSLIPLAGLLSCGDSDGVVDAHEARIILNKRKIHPSQYEERLLAESAKGSVNLTRYLICAGTNLNCRNNEGCTPLHLAVSTGRYKIAKLMLEAGADANITDFKGNTPLHYSTDEDTFNTLLHAQAQLDKRNNAGRTPLHKAAESNLVDPLQRLFKAGVDIDAQDTHGMTPLHLAARNNARQAILHLLNASADQTLKDTQNNIPLAYAISTGHIESMRSLLRSSAIMYLREHRGLTVHLLSLAVKTKQEPIIKTLHEAELMPSFDLESLLTLADIAEVEPESYVDECLKGMQEKGAAWNYLHEAVIAGKTGVVQLLLKKKYPLNATDSNGNSALHLAVQAGHCDIIDELTRAGCNQHLKNNAGETALRTAIIANNEQAVVAILAHSHTPEPHDHRGNTPLHLAAGLGNPAIIAHLIRAGYKVNAQNIHGCTPLHLAEEKKHEEARQMLLAHHADANIKNNRELRETHKAAKPDTSQLQAASKLRQLIRTIDQGNETIFLSLLNEKIDINGHDAQKQTPLHHAVKAKRITMAQHLIAAGAGVDAADTAGKTPLLLAVENGQEDMVDLLLKARANPQLADKKGNRPLHIAIGKRNEKIFDSLTSIRQDLALPDAEGNTPLHIAVKQNCGGIAEKLLKAGVQADTPNKRGITPLMTATSNRNEALVALLTKHRADTLSYAQPLQSAINTNNYKICKILIDALPRAKKKQELDSNILFLLISRNHTELALSLIATGSKHGLLNKGALQTALASATQLANTQATEALLNAGATPRKEMLLHAARQKTAGITSLLLAAGANPNSKDSTGSTPLHHAIKSHSEANVKVLLAARAKLHTRNKDKETPVILAAKLSNHAIMESIRQHLKSTPQDDRGTDLHQVIHADDYPLFCNLLRMKSNLESKDKAGRTPLHFACMNQKTDFASALIKAKVNIDSPDAYGRTPLHYAAAYGFERIILLLVKNKANIRAKDIRANTPCLWATYHNQYEAAALLKSLESSPEE